jgi:hypothetical protein
MTPRESRKVKRPLPPQELLREMLDYDAMTGVFTWKLCAINRNNRWVGRVAGTPHQGYTFINIHGFAQVGAHRLAWIYIHRSIPEGMEIDHIDGDKRNNSIANLRLATPVDNARNCGPRAHNKLGVKGVTKTKYGTYYARIKVHGREINLGYYKSLDEASAAYRTGELKLFGEFAR